MAELRRQYREAIVGLEDRLLAMGDRVVGMLDEALAALATHDVERAGRVSRADAILDAEHDELQERLFTTMALQAPVASELRLFLALSHSNVHIARMGDLCASLARFVQRVESLPDDPELLAQIQELGLQARRVVVKALESLARRDVRLADELARLDDPVDLLYRGLLGRLVQLATQDSERLDWAMRAVLATRYLERLGDHAVDIGDLVRFAVTGDRGGGDATLTAG